MSAMVGMTTNPTLLAELAERVEKANGPDRKLDVAVHEAAGLPFDMEYWTESDTTPQRNLSRVPRYTASLDAAMSLVPEGLHLSQFGEARFMTRSPCFSASIEQWVDEHLEARTPFRCHGVAATPALALCAAALRARAEQ